MVIPFRVIDNEKYAMEIYLNHLLKSSSLVLNCIYVHYLNKALLHVSYFNKILIITNSILLGTKTKIKRPDTRYGNIRL